MILEVAASDLPVNWFTSASINLEIYDMSDFDLGAPRWKRRLWVLVSSVFFQNPLPKGSRFRAAFLRAFGAKIGKDVIFGRNVYLLPVASRGWRSCLDRRRCWDSKPGAGYDRIECLRVPTLLSCYRKSRLSAGEFRVKGCAHSHSSGNLDCNVAWLSPE